MPIFTLLTKVESEIIELNFDELTHVFDTMSKNLFISKNELIKLTGLNSLEAECFFRRRDITTTQINTSTVLSMKEFANFISKERVIPIKHFVA